MADEFAWTAADGTTVNLSDASAGYSILANGTRGLRSVEYAFSTAEYAGVDGVQVQAVKASANSPTLGLMLEAAGETAFIAKSRALVRSMRPKAGPGTLTVHRSDGSSRSLTCYVTGGLEGDEAVDTTLLGRWWKLALKFMAPDPWWYGLPRSIDFGLSAPTVFFPIFPLRLSPSAIQGALTVDLSDSDAPTYPVWTVTGPGGPLTLTNTTTGRTIQVNTSIGDGQTIVIDTRPGMQSVRSGTGDNLMGYLASDPALWPLVESVNNVSALLINSTANSRITGTYAPRYSGI